MFEGTVAEHGLMGPWFAVTSLLLVAWHGGQRVAFRRAVTGSGWSDVWLVTGILGRSRPR